MAKLRVSELFDLGRTQEALEFLDVDTFGDTRLFIDPTSLKFLDTEWGDRCVHLLQDFFTTVIDSIRSGNDARAQSLLGSLNEPNETHLGLSRGRASGSGLGHGLAYDIWSSLRKSRATTTGLLSDLEDAVLFIDGIGHDRISDITTNIIREPLANFTKDACEYYGIPMRMGVNIRVWSPRTHSWGLSTVSLPVTSTGPLILVPKEIARTRGVFDPGSYYSHYVLPYYQAREIDAGRGLVVTLRSGQTIVRPPTKKALRARLGQGKTVNVRATVEEPSILEKYRSDAQGRDALLSHEDLAQVMDVPAPDWDSLLTAVLAVPPGRDAADAYEKAIEPLLTALFYPALGSPKRQTRIHEGRKRIDITYVNYDRNGFFEWLHRVAGIPSSQIAVECKNYGVEIGNPELDQLTGRFSVNRGKFGILCHRGYGDKALLVKRCRDTLADGRGVVIALDDDDLKELVRARKRGDDTFALLLERYHQLT